MPVAQWQPGVIVVPGQLVRPAAAPLLASTVIANHDFATAAGASWDASVTDFNTNWSFPTTGGYVGPNFARLTYEAGPVLGRLTNATKAPVVPGQTIKAEAYARLGGTAASGHKAEIWIRWLDGDEVALTQIGVGLTGGITGAPYNSWRKITVEATAPANAAFVQVMLYGYAPNIGHTVDFDNVSWNHVSPTAISSLLFRAVQDESGLTGTSEPVWPETVGETVEDNEVTWQATTGDEVLWEAKPILKSGATEPTWPTEPGAFVADEQISWEAITRRIEDERCPNSKVVAIASSKVFAGDDDIVAFSATVNPLDWSTREDAGYLPFGLQTYGSMPISAMGLYRSNLVIFNSRGFQMWQVDEDPANHAILDASPVGCPYHQSVQPVSNDLVFLTEVGIRNISIAGASTNLQAGFFGKQIDPLVLAKLDDFGPPTFALYYPGAGQYWLIFGAEAFVLTMNGGKDDMSWSRYTFPAAITGWTVLDDELVLRAGDLVWVVDPDLLEDDVRTVDDAVVSTPFESYVAWPYMDLGQIGREKQMYGFDLVMNGEADVSFGYAQENMALATAPYTVSGDTLTGQVIPMPLTGPSFQLRLTISATGGQPWEVQAAALYVNDVRGGT